MLYSAAKLSERLDKLTQSGDPLVRLNELIDWKIFMPTLSRALHKERKSNAGRKPFPTLMMFKILILQSLYNLSDHQTEFQIRDRLSFTRFLNLSLSDKTPDEKTIWHFRETLLKAGALEKIFDKFEGHLTEQGYGASCGSIIDASIVEAPKQRNSKDDNKTIKEGGTPESFKGNDAMLRQKDLDARWTKKNHQTYYGYKNHINIDAEHKLIRRFNVTPANMADINCFEELLDMKNTGKNVWADSAYFSAEKEKMLKDNGLESRVISRNKKHAPLWSEKSRENTRRAKIRGRVEHVFGFMTNTMHAILIRTIGLARAKAKLTLTNLTYNLCRYEQLNRLGVA